MSIFVDGHVHIYSATSLYDVLDKALQNFQLVAAPTVAEDKRDFCLLMTEGRDHNIFSALAKSADQKKAQGNDETIKDTSGWRIYTTPEEQCLIARNSNNETIFLYAGRQIISTEKLEVLALFSQSLIDDDRYCAEELAQHIWESGGIPLLPWGVGKWLGKRKGVVDRYIQAKHQFPILLGDNGNRPRFWNLPVVFSDTFVPRLPALAGSDPLPLKNHLGRAGSYGVKISGFNINPELPVTSLKTHVTDPEKMVPYGQRPGLVQFFRDQLEVNLRKRLPQFFQ